MSETTGLVLISGSLLLIIFRLLCFPKPWLIIAFLFYSSAFFPSYLGFSPPTLLLSCPGVPR